MAVDTGLMPDAAENRGRPLVSVITPAFQASASIGRTIRSVRQQQFAEWEMIVVDDGSTDGTSEVALAAAGGDPRVMVIRQANAGTGAARNSGLSKAQGQYLIFLDADDEIIHDYMDRQIAYMEANPQVAIVGCNVLMRDVDKDSLWTGPEVVEHSLSVEELLVDNTISVMALVRREAVEAIGGMRSVYAEDYDLWIRLLLAGYKHLHQPRVLGIYYRTPGSKSANRKREWIAVARMLRDYRREGILSPQQAVVAEDTQCRFVAMFKRVKLEEYILNRDVRRARRDVMMTARSFASRWKFFSAVLLTYLAPAMYRRLLKARPSGYTPFAEVK